MRGFNLIKKSDFEIEERNVLNGINGEELERRTLMSDDDEKEREKKEQEKEEKRLYDIEIAKQKKKAKEQLKVELNQKLKVLNILAISVFLILCLLAYFSLYHLKKEKY